jgi:hypothetical protein
VNLPMSVKNDLHFTDTSSSLQAKKNKVVPYEPSWHLGNNFIV